MLRVQAMVLRTYRGESICLAACFSSELIDNDFWAKSVVAFSGFTHLVRRFALLTHFLLLVSEGGVERVARPFKRGGSNIG
jgi:hypothetical protein